MDGTAQNGTSASLPPLQEQEDPDQHAPSTCDEQIMQAMKRLANVLCEARREAGEATVSAARKTELEAWIERHGAEIDAHVMVCNDILSKSRRKSKKCTERYGRSSRLSSASV